MVQERTGIARMRGIRGLMALVLAGAVLAGAARAQERAWLQIEAQPTRGAAEERARAYAGAFGNVAGFRLPSGWYAIVLGPYDPVLAARTLDELKRERLVPRDSFLAREAALRDPYWPPAEDPRSRPVAGAPAALPPAEPEPAPVPPEPVAPEPVTEAPAAALPAPEPEPEPEQTLAEARAAEAALSREERQAIQQALQWFGHYGAAIDGAFGPGTRAAIAAWQTAALAEPTGVLTTRQTAALLDAARRERAALDLGPVTEAEAGIEIALPRALVRFDRYEPPFALFGERDGSGFTVMLISQPGDRAALAGLYDTLRSLRIVPLEGAREIGERSFTLSGRNGAIQTRAYAETSGGLIKGWLVSAPLAQADTFDRVAAAMADSFRPLGDRALDPGLAPLPEATRAALLPGLDLRRPARSRSGFYIDGRGQVLTAAEAVAGCTRITLDGGVEATVAFADPALGIALLTPLAPLAPLRVAGLDAGGARPGLEVAAAGYPYEDALPAPTLTFGRIEATQGLNGETDLLHLSLPALAGDAGSALIGPTGAVLGLVLPAPADGVRALPPGVTFARSAAALSARLAAAGVALRPAAAQGALAPEDIARIGTDIGVLVSCWD